MIRLILAFGWLCATSAVAAPEVMAKLVTRDGREYQKVTIVGHDAIGIKIHHSGGMARLPFERLSDELQKMKKETVRYKKYEIYDCDKK